MYVIKLPNEISEVCVNKNLSLKESMRKIDKLSLGFICVVDDNKNLCGVATDGDIRRGIVQGLGINDKIEQVMNKNYYFAKKDNLKKDLLGIIKKISSMQPDIKENKKVLDFSMKKIPVVNENNKIVDLAVISGMSGNEKITFINEHNLKSNRSVLVVGGAGYLGSVLIRKLLNKGYYVKVLDILNFGDKSVKDLYSNSSFEFIKGDARNIRILNNALKDVDVVVHLAAVVGDPACREYPQEAIETNYLTTTILAQACKYHQINRFIFASTCSVYGYSPEKITEESELNPLSLYARSKIMSENSILALEDENFSPTILRMGTLYGYSPRMRFDLVVNTLTKNAFVNKKIEIFGGKQWRPLLHVGDAAEAYIRCIESPIEKVKGEIFNVGNTDENYQIFALGKLVKELMPEIELINKDKEMIEGKFDERSYNVCFDKIFNLINFRTTKSVKDGIIEIKKALENRNIENPQDAVHYNLKPKIK